MRCARLTFWGLGLGLLMAGHATADPTPLPELVLIRLANLTTAPESARIGFAFDLDGPPLVDELPAGALTTLLPGLTKQSELWVLPRGLTLPKSLPEPLALSLPGPGKATAAPLTVFLFDRAGHRGEPVRQLLTGAPVPAEGAQLRVLNLVGAGPPLDVCTQNEPGSAIARAVPAFGLSQAPQWSPAPAALAEGLRATGNSGLTVRVATDPACRGDELAALQLRLAERGAWTLVVMPMPLPVAARSAGGRAARVLLLDEASLLPTRAVPLLPTPGS